MKLFGRRRALAAGTVPPAEVFVEGDVAPGGTAEPVDADVAPGGPGEPVDADVAPGGTAEPMIVTRADGPAEPVVEPPITAPVPVVAGSSSESPAPPVLRFGFDSGASADGNANGNGAARELVPAGGAAAATAEGTVTTAPRRVISIGFDDELDEIETLSLDASPVDAARPDVEARLRARRIQVRRDEGRRRLRWAVVGGVVLTLLVAAGLVLESPLFAIDHVEVTGAVYTNAARLQQVVDDLEGATLIGADLGRVEATLAADPWVKRVRVQRRPLRGVRIEIVEREPVATYMGTDQRWRVLDPTGRILAALDPPGSKPIDPLELVLPAPGPDLEAGATAPAALTGAADVIPRLPAELRARTCSMAVGDVGQMALNFCDGYVVDLGQPEDFRDKLVTTMYVLTAEVDQVAASSRLNVSDASHPVLIQK